MILLADSGSTKCDWALIDRTTDRRIQTEGINPFVCDAEHIKMIIGDRLLREIPQQYAIERVMFFGAGCRDDKKLLVADCISALLPDSTVEVSTDLEGAAIALYGNKSGIIAILGTGSIACMYDGKNVIDRVPSLGYILGDEGSGSVLGQKLLGDCFKNQLPSKLRQRFFEKYPLTVTDLIDRVYRQPQPNAFMASFVPFLKENIAEAYAYNLVFDSFVEFFERNVVPCADGRGAEISFCGSVAYHFANVLETVTDEMGFRLGSIQKAPLNGLATHVRRTFYDGQ